MINGQNMMYHQEKRDVTFMLQQQYNDRIPQEPYVETDRRPVDWLQQKLTMAEEKLMELNKFLGSD